jgi:hypothetical protein
MSGSDKSPYVPKNKKNFVQEQSDCYALDQCKGRLEHHKSNDEQDIQNQGPSITAQVCFVLFCFVLFCFVLSFGRQTAQVDRLGP